MAPPQSTVVSPVVTLIIRLLTFVCLLISVVVLATNKVTSSVGFTKVEIKFNDFYAYRYMLATGVIGIAYTLLQIIFAVSRVKSGGDGSSLVEFCGEKVLSYILATGAAAGFGFTVDLNRVPGNDSDTERFLNKANVAASLLFIAFIFSAISSVISSLSFSRRG